MDAPLTADALIRPWRTATLRPESFVAALELIVLMVLALLLLAKPLAHAVQHHAEATALAPATKKHRTPVVHVKKHHVAKPKLSRSATGVFVFNGNGAREPRRLPQPGSPASATESAARNELPARITQRAW